MYEYGVLEAMLISLLDACTNLKSREATLQEAEKLFDYCQNHEQESKDCIQNLSNYIPDTEHDLQSKVDKITITIEQLKQGKKTTINI